jgi:uncharacterized protein YijF (DUF1287 family)/L,D-peptidoglycan transpeptidase YkuD (ErfK/YbiS/YcfS/YnhG family)
LAQAFAAWLLLGALGSLAAAQSGSAKPPVVFPAKPRANAVDKTLGVRDIGIFSDLDAQLQLPLPRTLEPRHVRAAVDRPRKQLVLYVDDWPIKVYPLRGSSVLTVGRETLSLRPADRDELWPLLSVQRLHVFERRVTLPPGDTDGDGIPDPLDISLGAQKTVLNADRYDGRYQQIPYPNGDVPRTMGVCTDVIVRALRNAGCDLQRALHEDVLAARSAYPMIDKPNASIDHRRVKSLLPYLLRHFDRHTNQLSDPLDPLRAGDIILMDTFPSRAGAEHVGLISDVLSPSGVPMVVNNWTDGTTTARMELLSWVPVTHRFRYPEKTRSTGPISPLVTQLVVVTSGSWDDAHGALRRYERTPGAPWRVVGTPLPTVLGHAGYAWGDGVHGSGGPVGRAGPTKREGDGRSPAGVFALGTLHGIEPATREASKLPYQAIVADQVCIDDPASQRYNQVVSKSTPPRNYQTAERMQRGDAMYDLALEVKHNRDPVVRGHGSCIFVHLSVGPNTRLTGCTGLSRADVSTLVHWLEPSALLVALPHAEYQALRAAWLLP